MQMSKLKNGTEEATQLVTVTMASLKFLWESDIGGMLAVSDFVQICRRDPKYKKFGDNEDRLKKLLLLDQNGNVNSSIRNIVLSAFTGEGLDLQMGSPIA